MSDSAVTIHLNLQVSAGDFPGRKITVAGGKTAVIDIIGIFACLLNLASRYVIP
jgi:hypothetical protein